MVAFTIGLAPAACSLMRSRSSPSSLATPLSANSNCSKLSSLLPFLPPGPLVAASGGARANAGCVHGSVQVRHAWFERQPVTGVDKINAVGRLGVELVALVPPEASLLDELDELLAREARQAALGHSEGGAVTAGGRPSVGYSLRPTTQHQCVATAGKRPLSTTGGSAGACVQRGCFRCYNGPHARQWNRPASNHGSTCSGGVLRGVRVLQLPHRRASLAWGTGRTLKPAQVRMLYVGRLQTAHGTRVPPQVRMYRVVRAPTLFRRAARGAALFLYVRAALTLRAAALEIDR